MIWIAYILSLIMVILILREICILIKDMKKSKCLYNDWKHNIEHIVILFLLIAGLITMLQTCGDEEKVPIIAYTMIVILFILPHLKKERFNQ